MSNDFFWGNIFKFSHKEETLFSFLKDNKVFENFSSREISQIEKVIHLRNYKKDEIVFKEDEPGTGMYLIKKGAIRLTKIKKNEDGTLGEEFITTLKQNDFLGELALIEKMKFPRTASAYAECDSELVGFFKPDLMEIIERNPRLGIKLILRVSEIIGARLRETTLVLTEKKEEIRKLKKLVPKTENVNLTM